MANVARMALGWLRWRAWAGVERGDAAAVGVAGVAFGDMLLGSTWQAWHSVTSTSTFVSRGRRGTYGRMALNWLWWRACAGVERGDAAAVGVAGVAFGDMLLGSTWQAWHSVTSTSTFVSRGRRGSSLCVAGVALGDIDLFTWQAWHLWHWAGSGGALGPEWNAGTLRLLAWQAWHLATCSLVPRGRRGTR